MVLGDEFAWAHMGKTGGDATLALFDIVGDTVRFRHDVSDRRKHMTFRSFGQEALDKPVKVLNIRRLPSWQLSIANHRSHHGTAQDRTPVPVPPADEMAASREGDEMLLSFTADGAIAITRWLRMENLRSDFARFVETLRPLRGAEIDAVTAVTTKQPLPYDHDYTSVFSTEQLRRLYEANPVWASVEVEAYGGLPAGL